MLVNPFSRAMQEVDALRQTISNDYKKLRNELPQVRKQLNKKVPGTNYTFDAAMRVYLWDKAGFDIPGLTKTDKAKLINAVKADADVQLYADTLGKISKQEDGYIAPGDYWVTESITTDLNNITRVIGRKEALSEFIENRKQIFGEWKNGRLVGENMNKIEATKGTRFREALEDMIWRMETGETRNRGSSRLTNAFTNWINNSMAAIMFFNVRSAVLQTLSAVNYINWTDNNPIKASMAFANQKQFWTDFATLWNSDTLLARRAGLRGNLETAELQLAAEQGGVQGVFAYLMKLGFTPTQIADSFAICIGGASMYRNRVNTYLKQTNPDTGRKYTKKQAQEMAFLNFNEVTQETQQSSRADMISMQQAGPLGRFILAFQNTPMQYARLTKKAILDLSNGRGDVKTNISKIVYYTAVQNLMFQSLQSALFRLLLDDEEDEEELQEWKKKKQIRVVNSMLDTMLRGMGVGGAVVATAKNMILKWVEQEQKGNFDEAAVLLEFLNLSPPVGSKARKIVSAQKSWKYNKDEILHMKKFDLDNPIWQVIGNVTEGATNIPLARLITKMMNVKEALDSDNATWQRLFLLMGWNTWDLGVKNEDLQIAADEVAIKKQEEKRLQKEQDQQLKYEKEQQIRFEGKTKEEIAFIKRQDELILLTKPEQEDMLLELGLSPSEIRSLKYEIDRVNKIIELTKKQ